MLKEQQAQGRSHRATQTHIDDCPKAGDAGTIRQREGEVEGAGEGEVERSSGDTCVQARNRSSVQAALACLSPPASTDC